MDTQGRTTLLAGLDVQMVGVAGESSDPSLRLAGSRGVSDVTAMVAEGIGRFEQIIRLYPWPTVLLGIGLGFVLARRMR